jgi:hypothetical protein
MHIYYVYQYIRKDGTPYYIGKGSGRRAYVSQRTIPRPTNINRIQIVAQHLSEPEAFLLESKLIAIYGRVDLGNGILHNKTDGGDGGHNVVNKIAWNKGKKQTPEHNQKISLALKSYVRTKEHNQKIKENHRRPSKGKHWWTDGVTELMSVALPGENFYRGRLNQRSFA